jgi:TfoX/Sxy family transcriptional regulator of competence genes
MAFDEGLAERLRELLQDRPGIAEKRMFGGLCLLARGHMFVGIVGEALMACVGPDAYAAALRRPHARVMDFTGRPMKGYVFVDPPGYEEDRDLKRWVEESLEFVGTLAEK